MHLSYNLTSVPLTFKMKELERQVTSQLQDYNRINDESMREKDRMQSELRRQEVQVLKQFFPKIPTLIYTYHFPRSFVHFIEFFQEN